MRLLTGDECGILKECLPSLVKNSTDVVTEEGIKIVNPNERPSRRRGVVDLSWTPRQSSSGGYSFAALRMDGSVQVWRRQDSNNNKKKKHEHGRHRVVSEVGGVFAEEDDSSSHPDDHGSGTTNHHHGLSPLTRPLGLAALRIEGPSESCIFAACNVQGKVSVLKADEDMSLSVVRRFSTFDAPNGNQDSQYPLASCMAMHDDKAWLAVGGKDRETSIYDVETAERVWKTKNLPPDPQTLLQPVTWPSAILFLNDQRSMVVGNDVQVRLYDVRVDSIQRRPIAYTPKGLLEQRVTCFCQTGDNTLVVGDTTGCLVTVDVRNLKVATNQARFVGPAGSVRQLVKHPRLPRMAAVGLDRMLRIYDTRNRKQVVGMYLKQRLNCVLMDDTDDDDDDDLAAAMKSGSGEGFDRHGGDIDDQDDVVGDYVDSDSQGESASDEEESDGEEESEGTGGSTEESSDDHDERAPTKRRRL